MKSIFCNNKIESIMKNKIVASHTIECTKEKKLNLGILRKINKVRKFKELLILCKLFRGSKD